MALLVTLLLFAASLPAQILDITVTDSVTRVPIPGIIVTLLGPDRYDGMTDDSGVLHIGPVQRGKYMLNIVKAGYILPPAGQASFPVDSDKRLSVELDPLCRVDGRVQYPDGRPAPRAKVSLSPLPEYGSRTLTVTADAGGHYLFEDVKPGQYLILASAAAADAKPEGQTWAATYFPSDLDRASATPIRATTGLPTTHDIRLRAVPVRHIRGIVRDEAGKPANDAIVTLSLGQAGERQTVETSGDGLFDFFAREGEWQLSATRKAGDVEARGFAIASVSKHDLADISVRLALPFSVPVLVERDTPPAGTRRPMPVMVFLMRLDAPSAVRPTSDALENVYPGRYRISAFQPGSGAYIESIKFGETEVYGKPFEIPDGSLPIRITYKYGAPIVRGKVEAKDGGTGENARVAFLNADESLTTESVQSVTAGRGGWYESNNLRPGDYYVIALDRADTAANTPAFRTVVVEHGQKIRLEKGSTLILNLKID